MLTTSNNRGFTLFIAITITATLLLIAAGIVSLSVRQSFISISGRESQHAFYAADTGIECALYWDIQNPSGSSAFSPTTGSQINCNNQTAVVGGSKQSTFSFNFLPDPYCAVVTVVKSGGVLVPGVPVSETFNSSTTWLAPTGVTSVQVEAWGSGGAGGNGYNDGELGEGGGGGGGGAYASSIVSGLTPGNGYTVNVGGESTYFINTSTVKAADGSRGGDASPAWPYYGAGGGGGQSSNSVGTTKYSGGTGGQASGWGGGGAGSAYPTANSGSVGTNWLGGAGYATGGNGSKWDASATGGRSPGAGGGGGSDLWGYSRFGAGGGAGRVVLTYTPMEEGGNYVTTIESRGYNTCSSSNPRRVERAVRAIY